MNERTYCSDLCLAADEPLLGTADRVDVWLLLEYKPVWKAKAVTDNDLSEVTRGWLQSSIDGLADKGLKARPQFIRRPELEPGSNVEETTLYVGTADELFEFSARSYKSLTDVDVVDLVEKRDGPRADAPRYFVCTNGQRDLCCARYGLPTYARLREMVAERVWQTTHLGGHRFAPNVLALPQGVLYGRVVPDEVEAFVGCVEAGEISRRHIRGRSVFPPPAQAAEILSRDEVIELVSVDGDDDRAQVELRTRQGSISIGIERCPEALDIQTSCKDEVTKPIYPYREQTR
ncbi:MAG: hypothetical protein O7H39_09570 [Gammaproteobacteria bacterium]|nr:hypothetical protein [Gammaproteobacteria bacterium]